MTNIVVAVLFALVPTTGTDGKTTTSIQIANVSQMTLEQCLASATTINANTEPYFLLCGPVIPKTEANNAQ